MIRPPEGFVWGSFVDATGAVLRTGAAPAAGPARGTAVVLTGFRECIEKYFDVARDLTARGFAVALMDWRGQGGSARLVPGHPQRMHSDGYAHQIDALHRFATRVVRRGPGVFAVVAHSMGGHIALRFLRERGGVFDAAVLTAPMLDIQTGPAPKSFARALAALMGFGPFATHYCLGGHDWREGEEIFEDNVRTGDRVRFEGIMDLWRDHPGLRAGGPTWGWLNETFRSIAVLNDEVYLRAITTPVLMQISTRDRVVDPSAAARAANLLSCCTRVDVADARHEIWMEADPLRAAWLQRVEVFLSGLASPAALC